MRIIVNYLIVLLIAFALLSTPLTYLSGATNQYQLTTIAGNGDYSEENGEALSASFRSPQSLLISGDGTLLISDTDNHRIRQLTDSEVASFAGFEFYELDEEGNPIVALLDGELDTAVFNHPIGMTEDSEGNIYVADSQNNAIRKISSDGKVSTIAGDGIQGQEDGKDGRFYHPSDVAIGGDGAIYVADTLNHLIRKIDTDGTVTTLNAASDRVLEIFDGYVVEAGDFKDGALSDAKFNEPSSLTIDSKGNIYVADSGNQVIRYIDLENETVSTVAGAPVEYEDGELYATAGYQDGQAGQAEFNFPKGIALTEDEALVIADSLNHSIRYLKDEQVSTIAGAGEKGNIDGNAEESRLHNPTDVAVKENGDILIADTYNNEIRQLTIAEAAKDESTKEKDNSKDENEQVATDQVKDSNQSNSGNLTMILIVVPLVLIAVGFIIFRKRIVKNKNKETQSK